ncbi:MAG: VOC family protein [Candidatus Promineifilaceae bacterium]|nr:VOC family protein [Candidatus Promineifilaceae bacterium]
MASQLSLGGIHHMAITVTDVHRSLDFYTNLLGFEVAAEFGNRVMLASGPVVLVLTPPPDPAQAPPADRFSEHRVGLDHLSFSVDSRDDLEDAARLFDEKGVDHGEIKPLEGFGIYVMAFRDPDNVQLELTAPMT